MEEPVTSDTSDLVVGTMRPPAWVGRVPPVAWVFILLAVADAFVRARLFGAFDRGPDPLGVMSAALGLVQPAAMVLLPAAVAWPRSIGTASRALMLGAVLLALAELVWLASRVADRLFPATDAVGATIGQSPADLFGTVALAAAVLVLGGVVLLAIGVRRSALGPGSRRAGRIAMALVAIATVGGLVDLGLLASHLAQVNAEELSLIQPSVLLANGVGIATDMAWGGLAALAVLGASSAGGVARGWRPFELGASLVVVSGALSTVLTVVTFQGPPAWVTALGQNGYLVFFEATFMVRVVGLLLVLLGLARGLTAAVATDAGEVALAPTPA